MFRSFLAVSILCIAILPASALAEATGRGEAQVETMEVGKPLARFSLLKPSMRIYLRYKVVGEARETLDIWRREVSFEEHEGQRELHIFWRWDSVGDQKFSRTEDFWFEPQTFRPLTVERHLTRDGKTTVGGYRYLDDRIIGMTDLPENDRKDFLQMAQMPSYNFETDMELLQTLPLRRGYQVRIPFYEAGPNQKEPRYYTYTVVGEDSVHAADGKTIGCWVVGIESDNPNWGPTRFWISKVEQVVLREQTQLRDGTTFVKVLLTGEGKKPV